MKKYLSKDVNESGIKATEKAEDIAENLTQAEVSVNADSAEAYQDKQTEIGKDMRSEKLRSMPIGKLLFQMSLPAIISMMVQALYNIVDSMYVTRISDANNYALDAVSIAFPMCMIVNSLAIAIGVGANALIARYLGERKHDKANDVARTALLMSLAGWLVFIILGFTISNAFVTAFTPEQEGREQIIEWGTQYLTIYLVGSLGVMAELPCIRILQATGNMRVPMLCQLVGACSNIILDPLFIFDWGFGLGVAGAAYATVISQWIAASVAFYTLAFRKQDVSVNFKGFRLQGRVIADIAKIGVPTFVMNAVQSFVTMIMFTIIGKYEGGISTISGYFKLQSFVYMPVFGMTQGATPILAYNYGANSRNRFNQTVKKIVIVAACMLGVGMVIFLAIPNLLVELFNPTEQMRILSVRVYRMISIGFLPSALGITCITVMQSLGKSFASMCLSLTRTVGLVIPSAILLDYLFGINGVWFCYPISEIVAVVVFLPIAVKIVRKCFAKKEMELLSK